MYNLAPVAPVPTVVISTVILELNGTVVAVITSGVVDSNAVNLPVSIVGLVEKIVVPVNLTSNVVALTEPDIVNEA
jgi:hypothetical protein